MSNNITGYELRLNSGENYTLSNAELNANEVTAQLNNQATTFVNFAGIVINKHIIIGLFPILTVVEGK